MTTRTLVAVILQPAGALAVAAGVALVNLPAGIIVAGVEATLFGFALELGAHPGPLPAAPEFDEAFAHVG